MNLTIYIDKVGNSYRITVRHGSNIGHVWYPTAQAALDFAHMYQVPIHINIQ